ncbi:MAG: hypothetical protein WA691_05700 [Thermoplasmata archaeon]
MDDATIELPGGPYRAVAFRAFNPATKEWSIWWLDSRFPGRLDPPVVGHFESGVGTFFADDTFEGTSIRVRFLWTKTDSPRPHWEQAFSMDNGTTWETNWEMDFERPR